MYPLLCTWKSSAFCPHFVLIGFCDSQNKQQLFPQTLGLSQAVDVCNGNAVFSVKYELHFLMLYKVQASIYNSSQNLQS
jgi:hypothetical protein